PEMFGNNTPQPEPSNGQRRNGFLALAQYDGNGDRIIDQQDPVFSALRLWQDKNHDGVSQPEELHKLPELGVAGLSVGYSEARRTDEHGNLYQYTASVYGTPGSTVGKVARDVWLVGSPSLLLAASQGRSPAIGSGQHGDHDLTPEARIALESLIQTWRSQGRTSMSGALDTREGQQILRAMGLGETTMGAESE